METPAQTESNNPRAGERKSVRTCSAHLARVSKAMDILLIENGTPSKVRRMQGELSDAWTAYENMHKNIDSFPPEEHPEMLETFDRVRKQYLTLSGAVQRWLERKQPSPSSDGSSGKTSTSARRRQIAELELNQAKRRHELERRRFEIEQQIELQTLEHRLARSELEDDDQDSLSSEVNEITSELPRHVDPTDERVKDYISKLNPESETFTPRNPRTDQDHGLKDVLSSVMETFSLPKPEILTFSGNPADYCKFIRNFETNIESRVKDNRLRLSYLIQYCSGDARRSVEDCVVLPSDEGYVRAKQILLSRYGKPHLVARSHVERLINGPNIRSNDVQGLMNLSLDMEKCELTLSQLGFSSDINNSENLRKIVRRLPMHIRSKWAEQASKLIEQGSEPLFKDLLSFIHQRALVANTMYGHDLANESKAGQSRSHSGSSSGINRGKGVTLSTTTRPSTTRASNGSQGNTRGLWCVHCKGGHKLINCEKFKLMDVDARLGIVRKHRMCENCLNFRHGANLCKMSSCCKVAGCREKHHTVLHKSASSVCQKTNDESTSTLVNSNCCKLNDVPQSKICLRIVPVVVKYGISETKTYALLDEGSDITLCSDSLVQRLGANGKPREFTITTVNQTTQRRKGVEVNLQVSAVDGHDCIDLRRVWSVEKLPISMESCPTNADIGKWKHLEGIRIPEIESSQVELLIGSDTPEAFWVEEQRRGKRGEPYAIRSVLGWTIVGPTGKCSNANRRVHFQQSDILAVHGQLERLWNSDFPDRSSDTRAGMSAEDRRALSIMVSTKEREGENYKLGLPWRDSDVCMPNNRALAVTRLDQLRRKLSNNNQLYDLYRETMGMYIQKGYAQPIDDETACTSSRVWYLPHHPVYNSHKPGKVRIVFDCAAKYRGMSLNDKLLQGPDLINSLVGVLTRFREQPVALVADIEAMFHQVKVRDTDRDALRFLWWSDGNMNSEPTEYCMTVHLFGATSSPSCAAYSLRCTASDNAENFSKDAVRTVERNFYVDDLLKSVRDAETGISLSSELIELLSKGGFRLTKWISNNKEVMNTFPETEQSGRCTKVNIEGDKQYERALGLQWYVEKDHFVFDVDLPDKCHTRRGILSVASSLFDPLGLVAPVTLIPKLILQNACRKGLQWDENLSDLDVQNWSEWLDSLPELSKVSINRCFQPLDIDDSSKRIELHMFSDASEFAYAAVVYIRMYDAKGNSKCSLVIGKSRLAPIKSMSIPRLELAAAVVAVKLYQLVSQELDLSIDERYFWTDSMIVLGYIRNEKRRFKTFVANRLAVIHDVTLPNDWRYVPSEINPADIASRGLYPHDTDKIQIWLNGPEFLQNCSSAWPQSVQPVVISADDVECKQVCSAHATDLKSVTDLDNLLITYSDWNKLQRAVAWLLRFKEYMIERYRQRREAVSRGAGHLTVGDLRKATDAICVLLQRGEYSKEINSMLKSGRVPEKSALGKLSPHFTNDLLKVGGRLENADMHNGVKHQIILPGNHHVTRILIRSYHELNAHMGAHHILSLLRQKYWIMPGLRSVKSVLNNCLLCKRQNARPETQQMGQLPAERLEPDKPPFTYVGVDFFGPMFVKCGRKQLKRYGCLFTCMCTRAVHIEITHSLNTDSFICAMQRFMSRRGKPERVFSDNGTNLVAGEKELRESLHHWNQLRIANFMQQRGISWHFNPPYASHMGGVWERLIRSFKTALKSVVREQLLNDEALLTLAAEVEKILNDRPITQVSDDPRDPQALSPNQILLMRPNTCFPPGVFDKGDNYCRRWWRQVQYLSNVFWKRWLKEYLPNLQVRQKWKGVRRNLEVNDLVLICDENLPRGQWPLGLVLDVNKGRDGLVRSCKVRVNGTEKVRPLSKLCVLEHNT